MHMPNQIRTVVVPLVVAAALAGTGAAAAAPTFTRISSVSSGAIPSYGMTRTADGVLHLVYQTAPTGLAAETISPSGHIGVETTALSAWQAGHPGLVLLPNGMLEAIFGAIAPSPVLTSSVWGITSADGGATWSAPANVRGGGALEALAYGSDVTVQMAGSTPVVTLPQAGGLVVQQGLGAGSPAALVTNSSNNAAGNVNSAVDAAAGAVVAGWQSLAGSAGGDYMQQVAPSVGASQLVPGQLRNQLVVAGRDTGPGVFAAYTSDGKSVRLVRYGGGTVAVGSLAAVTPTVLGVATGLDGRIWVMWGSDSTGIAVTRSNKAVTKFEPIQYVKYFPSALGRLGGDGRLGPLDLLADVIPPAKSGPVPPIGTFYARVLAMLTAATQAIPVKNGKGEVVAHTIVVTVTDAGDPVAGAKVTVAGKTKSTNASGIAKLSAPASGTVTVTVTSPGYSVLTKSVTL
jgi:hypothetical protein